MKKSLVLAMAMAMGVTASAYAANPFSDVPSGHWAYDSIAQLADAGVVDGYGATFGGDKLMTRYEMAQIVAKAMAKGANCDKLAAEFADELDALGVRVAKLEKKVDNVKITGNIRYSYKDGSHGHGTNKGGDHNGAAQKSYNRFRTRLFVAGQVNNNWKYNGMIENDRYMASGATDQDKTILKRATVDGRLGGLKVSGGRKYFNIPTMIDSEADGLEVKYGFGKVNLTGWAMKNLKTDRVGGSWGAKQDDDRVYMAKVDGKFGKLGALASYWKVDAHDLRGDDGEIWTIGADYPVAKDLKLSAEYFHGDKGDSKGYDENGYFVELKYRGAKAAKPGTWGLWVAYHDRPATTMISPSTIVYAANYPNLIDNDGFKGFEIGGQYTLAKNIVAGLRYYDFNGREKKLNGDKSNNVRTVWGEVIFTF